MEEQQINLPNFTPDLSKRILEDHEVISGEEGRKYAHRVDNRSLNYSMVAKDIAERFNVGVGTRVLEVCAGAGQLSSFIYEYTKSRFITATDGSRELIEAARQRYLIKPIRFEVQNVHNHPYRGLNDVVVCKDSFHHFEDPSKALEELLTLTRPGGAVYIYDLARDAPIDQVVARINSIPDPHEKERALRSLNASFTTSEIEELLNSSSASSWQITYPLRFSEENLKVHQQMIDEAVVKEHEFDRLSRIIVLYNKGKGGENNGKR